MDTLEDKETIHYKIFDSVFFYEVTKGHLKWTVSDISKHSGVTRSLIYYYLGKEKENYLDEAWTFMLELFIGSENCEENKKLGVHKRMEGVLQKIKSNHYIFLYYFKARTEENKYGTLIREREANLLKRLQLDYQMSETEALKTYLLELGACVYQLPSEKVSDIFPK